MARPPLALLATLALTASSGARVASAVVPERVIVVRVAAEGAAAAAGLVAGDEIEQWDQGADHGLIASTFDLGEVEAERGPRGPVRLSGRRAGASLTEAEGRAESPPDAAAWAWLELARAEALARRWDAVEEAGRRAVQAAQGAEDWAVEARTWTALGGWLRDADRLDAAAAALDHALALRVEHAPFSLATAALQEAIGLTAYARGHRTGDDRRPVEEALAVLQRLAPRSLAVARTLYALGWLAPSTTAGGDVNDAATALLMRRFYGYLKAALPKAEALRRAQVDLLRRPDTSAPYFWGAFHLVGDGR